MWIKFLQDIDIDEGSFKAGDVVDFDGDRANRLILRNIAQESTKPERKVSRVADVETADAQHVDAEEAVIKHTPAPKAKRGKQKKW